MKFQIILTAVASALLINASAQNTPNGSGLPSGSLTGLVTYPLDFNQSPNSVPSTFNYTRRYTPLVPMLSLPTSFDNTAGMPILVETSFQDGFGNSVLGIKRSNHIGDIVTPYYNRPSKTVISYLPYHTAIHSKFRSDAFSAQKNYYNALYNAEGYTAYSKTVSYSDNGLATTKAYSPGSAHVGQERGVTLTNDINTGGEVYIIALTNGNICTNGTYPAGTLTVDKTVGQHGQVSIVYKDKSGRLICKKSYAGVGTGTGGWLETYYVYNEMGKIIYVIPPKAAKQFTTSNCLSDVDKLCYSYSYNEYGEIVEKTTPGKTESDIIVYDTRHRPVLTQTPLLKGQNKYTFTIYDQRSRVVMSGILDNSNYNHSTATWQSLISSGTSSIPLVGYLHSGFSGSTYPTSITDCDIQVFNYYDSYANLPSPANAVSFSTAFANDYLVGAQMVTPEPYYFMHGKLVGSKTKILNPSGVSSNFTNTWITSVVFYDEKARVIQTHTLNPWNTSTWDVSAAQYDFIGNNVLTISTFAAWSSSNKPGTKIQVWNDYDYNTGILKETKQKIDLQTWTTIVRPYVDALGRVSRKRFGQVEIQDFTYNIRGQLTGINASSYTATTFPQYVTFSERLNYEAGFTERRYDGSISGFEWRTTGSHPSAYGYLYDTLGRMISAEYRDFNSGTTPSSWNKTQRDFSVSGITYDENGNMLAMQQYGYDQSMLPVMIDDLEYTYDAGNQLQQVSDGGTDSPIDDFDNSNGTTSTYGYDADGNLTSDALKGLTISYNHQALPLVVARGADTIRNIYDAGGTLIQKTIDENIGITTTWRYWGPYVFRNDSLLYILHGEGRAKWYPDSNFFKYDYFVKDHLGNVRTVVTSDLIPMSNIYLASHEVASANIEESFFDNLSDVRDIKPGGTPSDVQCERLNGNEEDRRIGAAIILRVMAGDKINVSAYSYHGGKEEDNNHVADEAMMEALLGALAGGSGGFEGGEEDNGITLTQQLIGTDNFSAYSDLKNSLTNPANPRAFLNLVVFDQEMNLDEDACTAVQVNGTANSWQGISLPSDLEIKQDGYVAIFLSGEEDLDVFFDNLNITHHNGRLLEQQHYYPHGLLIKSTAANSQPENRYHYQGKELQTELGMQLYDFHARQYDPQIGRFWGIDPMDQFPSGYTGMGNDPANNIDPSGMWANTHDATGQYRKLEIAIFAAKQAKENLDIWMKFQDERIARESGNSRATGPQPEGQTADEDATRQRGNFRNEIIWMTTINEKGERKSYLAMKNESDADYGLTYMGNGSVAITPEGTVLSTGDEIERYKNNGTSQYWDEKDKLGSESTSVLTKGVKENNLEFQSETSSGTIGSGGGRTRVDQCPTVDKGGIFYDRGKFIDFMKDAAVNASNTNWGRCEVSAWEVNDGEAFIVEPWINNKEGQSNFNEQFVERYGYNVIDITAQWHTHPSNPMLSDVDKGVQKQWGGRDIYIITGFREIWRFSYPDVTGKRVNYQPD